jgi:hypothetical protein
MPVRWISLLAKVARASLTEKNQGYRPHFGFDDSWRGLTPPVSSAQQAIHLTFPANPPLANRHFFEGLSCPLRTPLARPTVVDEQQAEFYETRKKNAIVIRRNFSNGRNVVR